jgi:hypothetical protein
VKVNDTTSAIDHDDAVERTVAHVRAALVAMYITLCLPLGSQHQTPSGDIGEASLAQVTPHKSPGVVKIAWQMRLRACSRW